MKLWSYYQSAPLHHIQSWNIQLVICDRYNRTNIVLNIKLWVIDFSVLMIVSAVSVGLVKIALTRQISVSVDRPVRGAGRH